jgi:opacity protein-like surface antigen
MALIAVAAVAACLLAPPAARAQGETWASVNIQRMVEEARWRVGALRLNAAFRLSRAGYDSDIYFGYFDQPVADVTASASIPIQVLLPLSKKAVIDVSETPEYDFYLDSSDQRAWNNRLNGRLHLALDKVYIQAGGGMSNVRRRFSPELDLNVRQKTDNLNALILWQASRNTSLAVLYGGAQYRFDEDVFYGGQSLADRLNRNEEYVDLIGYVRPSARLRLSLDAQYGSYQFRRSLSKDRNSVSFAFFAGVEFIPTEGNIPLVRGVRGTAALGYMRLDVNDPLMRDGSGLVGEADVRASLSRRVTGHMFFSRGFRFSIYSGVNFYLATTMGAGITRHLSRKADVGYEFMYGRTAYPELDEGDDTPYYRYLTHSLNLGLRLARYLGMTISGSFGQRDRGGPSPLMNRFFVGLSLVYGFTGSGMSAPTRGGIR